MLSIPTILEEILSTLLQYVDTAMVGHLGEKATASVSVTTTVTWLVNSIPGGTWCGGIVNDSKGTGERRQRVFAENRKADFNFSFCVWILPAEFLSS